MGNALRVMDRGVAAADTIVNNLVLSLGSTIIECIATITILIL